MKVIIVENCEFDSVSSIASISHEMDWPLNWCCNNPDMLVTSQPMELRLECCTCGGAIYGKTHIDLIKDWCNRYFFVTPKDMRPVDELPSQELLSR